MSHHIGKTGLRWVNNIGARRILNILAAISVFIYGAALLSLHQDQSFTFNVEEDGPFPAAISHRLYGSARGLADTGLVHYFWTNKAQHSAAQAVDQAMEGKIAPTGSIWLVPDGIGVGTIITTELAFALFGPHAHSMALLFIFFLGLSTVCFMFRYRDDRVSAVPIVFLTFTLLLITPFTDPLNAAQAPVGGMRSYALIGILPALYWLFELAEIEKPSQPNATTQAILLAIQVAILGLSILVRGSTIYMLIPVVGIALIGLYRQRGKKIARRRLLILLLFPAALLVGLGGLTRATFSDHAHAGRLIPVVWHRVFISLGANPEWPFAGLREKYRCPGIPEGLVPSTIDRNGHCVWLAYTHALGIPEATAALELYNADYERGLRTVFFTTLVSYPRQTIETFLYYKPKNIAYQIGMMFSRDGFHATRSVVALIFLQVLLVIGFIGIQLRLKPLSDARRQASVLLFFLVPAFIPQLAGWTLPATAIDFFAYWYAGCVIFCWMIVAYAFRLFTANRAM